VDRLVRLGVTIPNRGEIVEVLDEVFRCQLILLGNGKNHNASIVSLERLDSLERHRHFNVDAFIFLMRDSRIKESLTVFGSHQRHQHGSIVF